MKCTILIFICVAFIHFSFAQTAPPEYNDLVKKAFSLYKAKNYKASADTYSAAFKTFGWLGYMNDRYIAACSWARAGYSDSAFFNLNRIVSKGYYKDYDHIIVDSDLISLHEDKRWIPLLEGIKKNKNKEDAYSNNPLVRLLDSMAVEDQKWRNLWISHVNKEQDSVPLDTIMKYWILTDSLNYFKVREVFSLYCFPNYDLVGERGAQDFWLLVQHQDKHPMFQDSVLTEMKKEVDKGKASVSNYAYLVDRVAVHMNHPQVYGTQMFLNSSSTAYESPPVIEPEKLNERRKSVGLPTIEEAIATVNKLYSGSLKKK